MALGSKVMLSAAALMCLPAALPAQQPRMAEDVFKNIQVLKGIPVDEFMSTMGVFSAALGMSCEDCHASNDSSWENYALDTSPRKVTARRMVGMMSAINRGYFNGRQGVTCYTCHRGGNHPRVTPDLATLYSAPLVLDDEFTQAAGAPPADQVLDKYIQALGGAGPSRASPASPPRESASATDLKATSAPLKSSPRPRTAARPSSTRRAATAPPPRTAPMPGSPPRCARSP